MAYITGSSKYEIIYGTSENDVIDSKGGSDLIYDRTNSNDTYIFDYGYGQPTFTDSGGHDAIVFGSGIKASDIKFYITRGGYLMPRIKDTVDKPEIAHWPESRYKLEEWRFQDGTVLTSDDVDRLIDYNTRVLVYSPGADTVKIGRDNNLVYLLQGNDTIYTTGRNNIIEAASGNDKIYNYASSSNDEIYMGIGTDYTEDRSGNDRYIYNKGDGTDTILDLNGNDTIKFGRTVLRNNVGFTKSGNDLVITFSTSSSDKLIIKNWLQSSSYRIETLEFWDGSTISAQYINQQINSSSDDPPAQTIVGTDSNNYLSGYTGDNSYYAKKGYDNIRDNSGNDTYIYNKGDETDVIQDYTGNDKISFGEGITKSSVTYSQSSYNMYIRDAATNELMIGVLNWFKSDAYKIETVKFADGSTVSASEINQLVQQIASFSSNESQIISTNTTATNQQNITLIPTT